MPERQSIDDLRLRRRAHVRDCERLGWLSGGPNHGKIGNIFEYIAKLREAVGVAIRVELEKCDVAQFGVELSAMGGRMKASARRTPRCAHVDDEQPPLGLLESEVQIASKNVRLMQFMIQLIVLA